MHHNGRVLTAQHLALHLSRTFIHVFVELGQIEIEVFEWFSFRPYCGILDSIEVQILIFKLFIRHLTPKNIIVDQLI